MVPDDPDDPIDLGATEPSRSHVPDDIHIAQSLEARCRDGESLNAPDMGGNARAIEEPPASTEKAVMTVTALQEENEKSKSEREAGHDRSISGSFPLPGHMSQGSRRDSTK